MRFDEFIGFKTGSGLRATLSDIREHPFHLHGNVLELVLVVYGTLVLSDSARDHELFPGDVYLVNPNDPHRIRSKGENAVLTIYFDRSSFLEEIPDIMNQYYVCFSHPGVFRGADKGTETLRFFAAQIWQEWENEKQDQRILHSLALSVIQTMQAHFGAYTYKRSPSGAILVGQSSDQAGSPPVDRDYRVVDVIYDRFREKLTLSRIAGEFYISSSHLSRSLVKNIGLSFSEILSLARVEEAERLLFSSQKSVDEIADEAGFANRKHLALQFKRWYGKTPTEFRKAIRQTGDQRLRLGEPDFNRAEKVISRWLSGKSMQNQPMVVEKTTVKGGKQRLVGVHSRQSR